MTFTVFVVDDDVGVLKALSRRLSMKNYSVLCFASPQEFLGRHDPQIPGCALLDVSMPGLDGLELQQVLSAGGARRPIIFLTGKGDIPTSVRAMRAGAIDFLTKPVDDSALLDALARAEKLDTEWRLAGSEASAIRSRIASLTPRERDVLAHVMAGKLNKQIAYDLGTVEQTIKVHRRRMMEKLGARSMLDLTRLMAKAGPLE
ncbi:MAG: response regulator transcription factor [Parvibaculaceae bacterium]